MKRVFRSILNIKKNNVPTIPLDELIKNYRAFLTSKISNENPSHIILFEWVESHYRLFKEMPSIELLYEKANNDGNTAVLALLTEIAPEMPYWGSDYKAILKETFDEQCNDKLKAVLEKTWQVAKSGLSVRRGKRKREIKGINEAIGYFGTETKKLLFDTFNIKIESQIKSKQDKNEVLEDYEKRRRDPLYNMGMYVDLIKIDTVFRGIKPGDLFLVAAFVGQGKTTFVVNLAYSGIMQGLNGVFITLEMPFKEMRDMIYVLHTSYPGWYETEYKDLTGRISYEKVRYGELSQDEYDFFTEASENFAGADDFGELFIHEPPGALTLSVLETIIHERNTELKERGKTLDFLIVDYIGLMVPDKTERYGDFNIDLNNIIKRLKNWTMTFDNGRGLRIISPFQVNRDGWREAVKNDGIYRLTALSNANEAERSSDGIIGLFFNEEMQRNGIMKVSCLKHRDGAFFTPFEASIDFNSKKIRDFSQFVEDSKEEMGLKDLTEDIIGNL